MFYGTPSPETYLTCDRVRVPGLLRQRFAFAIVGIRNTSMSQLPVSSTSTYLPICGGNWGNWGISYYLLVPGRACLWSPRIATEEGIRAASIAVRRAASYEKGFGQRRSNWHRKACSAYTWLRTGRGPQKSWLHRIWKAADMVCPCGHPVKNGQFRMP